MWPKIGNLYKLSRMRWQHTWPHAFSQRGWDVLLAVRGEDRLLSVLPLCGTDLQSAAWWFFHGGGIWRREPVRKYKSVWSREEVQVLTSLCHKEPGTILPRCRGHSPHPRERSETETKLNLVIARMSCASHGGCTNCMCSSWR